MCCCAASLLPTFAAHAQTHSATAVSEQAALMCTSFYDQIAFVAHTHDASNKEQGNREMEATRKGEGQGRGPKSFFDRASHSLYAAREDLPLI